MENSIAIYGAYGHTGKFIVAELQRQGYHLILSGRDEQKLSDLHQEYPEAIIKAADIKDSKSLDDAFSEAKIVINCAGPFLDTAKPIIESAIRLGIHYIDLSAEQKAVLDVIEHFSEKAKMAEILVIPAVAFYGGLGDLLSTSITKDWNDIDEIKIYIGLDSWHSTKGTRLTGDRNHYTRLTIKNNELQELEPSPPIQWDFKNQIGVQDVVALPLSEIITISSHLKVKSIDTYLSQNSLDDLRNAAAPEPKPSDEKNRSSQRFCLEVVAINGNFTRTITAHGQDIYAVTAPLVAETVNRILAGKTTKHGVAVIGELFDAADFLHSLNEDDIIIY